MSQIRSLLSSFFLVLFFFLLEHTFATTYLDKCRAYFRLRRRDAICHRPSKVTQPRPAAEARRVRRPRRAETVVAATVVTSAAVAVAAAAAAPVYPLARCGTRRRILQQSRRRRPRAIRADAAATGTAVATTGDNTQEKNG